MGVEDAPDGRRRPGLGARPARLRPDLAGLDRLGARRARESARRARETLSVPMWEVINTTYRAIPSGPLPAARPPGVFQWVRERAALINGTADATMTRDEGWHFLMLGRCVERADMTSRLVATASLSARQRRAVDQHAARVRRLRGVPAHLPRPGDRAGGRGVPAARPALPAVGGLLAQPRRAVPRTTSRRPASAPASRTRPSGCSAGRGPSSSTARCPTCWPTCPTRWSGCSAPAPLATEAVTRRYFAGAEALTWQGDLA